MWLQNCELLFCTSKAIKLRVGRKEFTLMTAWLWRGCSLKEDVIGWKEDIRSSPKASQLEATGIVPSKETAPCEERNPKTPQQAAGTLTSPTVSIPAASNSTVSRTLATTCHLVMHTSCVYFMWNVNIWLFSFQVKYLSLWTSCLWCKRWAEFLWLSNTFMNHNRETENSNSGTWQHGSEETLTNSKINYVATDRNCCTTWGASTNAGSWKRVLRCP